MRCLNKTHGVAELSRQKLFQGDGSHPHRRYLGRAAGLVQQAAEMGAKTLMMTGNPDRIVEFDGGGQPYLSKPFTPELFVQRVEEILAAG